MAVKIFTKLAFEVLDNLVLFSKVSLQTLVLKTGESRAAILSAIEFLAMSGLAGEKYGSVYFPTGKGVALLSPKVKNPALLSLFQKNGWPHPLTLNKVLAINESFQDAAIRLAGSKVKKPYVSSPVKSSGPKNELHSKVSKHVALAPKKTEVKKKDIFSENVKKEKPPLPFKKTPLKSSTEPQEELNEKKPTTPLLNKEKAPLDFELKGAGILHLTPIQCHIVSILLRERVLSGDGLCLELEKAGYTVSDKSYLLLRPLVARGFIGFNGEGKGYEVNEKGRTEILEAKGIAMDILDKLELPYFGLRAIELIRDQGGKNGLAKGRFDKSIARAVKEKGEGATVQLANDEVQELVKTGLINCPDNGMVMLSSTCRSLIGIRPYTKLDIKRLRESGKDSFADLLIQYGEEKLPTKRKSKTVKASSTAKNDNVEDTASSDNSLNVAAENPGENDDDVIIDDFLDDKLLDDGIDDFIDGVFEEESGATSEISDALSAIDSFKDKINKPELPGVENSSSKAELLDAIIDLFSGDDKTLPVFSVLTEIKRDLFANAIENKSKNHFLQFKNKK